MANCTLVIRLLASWVHMGRCSQVWQMKKMRRCPRERRQKRRRIQRSVYLGHFRLNCQRLGMVSVRGDRGSILDRLTGCAFQIEQSPLIVVEGGHTLRIFTLFARRFLSQKSPASSPRCTERLRIVMVTLGAEVGWPFEKSLSESAIGCAKQCYAGGIVDPRSRSCGGSGSLHSYLADLIATACSIGDV